MKRTQTSKFALAALTTFLTLGLATSAFAKGPKVETTTTVKTNKRGKVLKTTETKVVKGKRGKVIKTTETEVKRGKNKRNKEVRTVEVKRGKAHQPHHKQGMKHGKKAKRHPKRHNPRYHAAKVTTRVVPLGRGKKKVVTYKTYRNGLVVKKVEIFKRGRLLDTYTSRHFS